MKHESTGEAMVEPTDRERLMALLALTTQELPIPPRTTHEHATEVENTDSEFRRLDADPALLERYLRRGMRALPANKTVTSKWRDALLTLGAWLAPPRIQFAAAATVVIVGTLVVWQVNSTSLLDKVEQGYSADVSLPQDGLVLPWERRAQTQGFTAQAGNDTQEGRAFATGLQRGRSRMQGGARFGAPSVGRANERFVALGEWNVLLWTASSGNPNLDSEFWNRQLSLARVVSAAFAESGSQLVAAHASATEALIADMAAQPDPRKARRLADELARFREAFAPLRPDAIPPP